MSSEKRARQKAGRDARRAAAEEAAARAKRRKKILRVVILSVVVLGVILIFYRPWGGGDEGEDRSVASPPTGAEVVAEPAGSGDDRADEATTPDDASTDDTEGAAGGEADDATSEGADGTGTTEGDEAATPDDASTGETVPDAPDEGTDAPDETGTTGETDKTATGEEDDDMTASAGGPAYTPYRPGDYGSGACAPAGGSAQQVLSFDGAPALCIDTTAAHTAVFDTSRGVVRVALDVANTPGTANSFVNLARFGYYDGTLIHRSDPSIGILQGGSPHTNSAADPGPGYTLWDEGTGFTYRPGQLVMARRADVNSGGAQYFFTVNERAGLLDGQGTYVVFGEVTEGLDVLIDILASHTDDPASRLGGAPDPPVTVNSLTIETG